MRTLFDTSVLVPAVTDQLGNHEAALDALSRYTQGEHEGYQQFSVSERGGEGNRHDSGDF